MVLELLMSTFEEKKLYKLMQWSFCAIPFAFSHAIPTLSKLFVTIFSSLPL